MAETKKTTNTGRISAKQKEAMRKAKMQLYALFTFAFGILLAAIVFIEGSSLWTILHKSMFGLFGGVAYFIPVILIYIAVITAMDRPTLSQKSKIWQSALLVLLICGGVQIIFYGAPIEIGLWNQILELWNSGIALKGGGLLGAALGLPLLALFGKTGAAITLVLLSIIMLMIITGTTLKGLYLAAAKPVKEIEKAYVDKILEEKPPAKQTTTKAKKSKFNIDVPVDDPVKETEEIPLKIITNTKTVKPEAPAQDKEPTSEMPAHPVTSPEEAKSEVKAESKVAYIDDIIKNMTGRGKGTAEHSILPPADAPPVAIPPMDASATPEVADIEKKNSENPVLVKEVIDSATSEIQEVLDKEAVNKQPYSFPPVTLLKEGENADDENISEELKANAQRLVDTLQSFGVQTRITEICRGPAVTRYELQPSAGVKISKITNLSDDIALNLAAAGVRIEAPIPNKAAVGIEVPNKNITPVAMREIIDSTSFLEAESRLSVALGKDIAGNLAIADLAGMPHVLIAGATGSGKSVCINSIIISLLFKASPDEVKLLMIDPKVVELGIYNGIPHLLVPVVTDPGKAAGALNWAVNEMLKRYKMFADNGVRDLKGYNKLAKDTPTLAFMPQIVIIIDELADLMMAAPNEVEDAICRLAQMARAAGMHLVIATQRPSVDVITGVIKANIPSRIAFSVSSQVDSRTILDGSGAEKLLGKGDMLFYPVGYPKPVRVQGCFVSDKEVEKVVTFIKEGEEHKYDEEVIEEIDRRAVVEKSKGTSSEGGGFEDEDEMLPAAIEVVIEAGQASTSLLQRKLKLGYARAARIVDQLEERGIVGPFEGSKPRQVLISRERWQEMKLSANE